MNIIAHVTIGHKIKPILEERLDIIIKPASFLYGTVRPDVKKREMKYHVNHHCVNHLTTLTNNLYSSINSQISYSNFMVELGSICHFICDYFCYPHNEHYTGSRSDHHIYEQNQVFFINKNINSILNNLILEPYELFNSPKDILNAVESLHEEYLKNDTLSDHEKDVTYALRACLLATESLYRIYLAHTGQKKMLFKNA
ncbi:MAG: zinc dependent phospholipase C family protein [Clostridium sp.]